MVRKPFTAPTSLALALSLLGCSQTVSSGAGAIDAGPSVDRETSGPADLPAPDAGATDGARPLDGAVDGPSDAVAPPAYPINLGDDQYLFLFEGATLLRMSDGRVYGWGNGLAEALQDNTIPPVPPTEAPSRRGQIPLSLDFARYRYVFGNHFGCRAERAGDRVVSCRGTNENAALGVLTDAGGRAPYFDWQPIPELTNVHALAAGDDFVCAWNERAWCWGHYRDDSFARDEFIGPTPVPLGSVTPRTVISQWGTYPVCATAADGTLSCMGNAGFETDPSGMAIGPTWWRDFMRIEGVRNVSWVTRYLPSTSTLIIDGEGALWCRGHCRAFGFDTIAPRRVEALPPLRQILQVRDSLFAVTRDGRLLSGGNCESYNVSDYCLGLPRPTSVSRPLEPATFVRDVVEVSGSSAHACVLNRAGALWCWGINMAYQITNAPGASMNYRTPIQISLP